MASKRDIRAQEFAMMREWAEKQSSEKLKIELLEKKLRSGYATAAREVLRARGETH